MRRIISPLIAIAVVLGCTAAGISADEGGKATQENQMIIRIGAETFTATLAENPTATAFKARLPLTLKMADLNDNEKVVRLAADLPTNDSNPKQIHAGDLMIWRSRSLVLFYKGFPTPYSYTKLGRINDVTRLSAVVGSGDVTATFEMAPRRVEPTSQPGGTK